MNLQYDFDSILLQQIDQIPPSARRQEPENCQIALHSANKDEQPHTISCKSALLYTLGKNRYLEIFVCAAITRGQSSVVIAPGKFKVLLRGARDLAIHGKQVGDLAARIACELGMDRDEQEALRMAGLIHDIAISQLPTEVVFKSGQLSKTESELIEGHPEAGEKISGKNKKLNPNVRLYVFQHHERLDGSGYPLGLKGDSISFGARILAVADVYDAMTSDRPHRKALSCQAAVSELLGKSGHQFDCRPVESLIKLEPWTAGRQN